MPSEGKTAASQMEEKNPILQLNDIRKDCVYELKPIRPDNLEKQFAFKLTIDGKTFEGSGPSKKAAKAAVATKALKHPAVNVNANAFKAQQVQMKKNTNQNRQQQNRQQNKQQFQGQKKQTGFGQPNNFKQGQKPIVFNQGNQAIYNNRAAQINDSLNINCINGKQVCQYYLNGLCLRGKNCPNYHPEYSPRPVQVLPPRPAQALPSSVIPSGPQVPVVDTYMWLQFCQNYRSLRCPRSDCKFLHVSKDDEEVFLATRKIPAHVVEQAVRKAIIDDIAPPGVRQTCKAYLDGHCNWYSCPFRHLNRQEFSHEVLELLKNHFEKTVKPREDYRLISNRLVDRELPGYDARKLLRDGSLSDKREFERLRLDSRLSDRELEKHGSLSGGVMDSATTSSPPFPSSGTSQYTVVNMVEVGQDGSFSEERMAGEMDIPDGDDPTQLTCRQLLEKGWRRIRFRSREGGPRDWAKPVSAGLITINQSLSGTDDWLVKGMQNLMREKEFSKLQEMEELRDELRILQEENEKLRKTVRTRSMEEEKYNVGGLSQERSLPRADLFKEEFMFQDKIKKIKDENEAIRRVYMGRDLERQYPVHQSNPLFANPGPASYYQDMRSELRRQNPESYNFDELLNSGIIRRENEMYQHPLVGLPLNSARYPIPQKGIQQVNIMGQHQKMMGQHQKDMGQQQRVMGQQNAANYQVKKVYKVPTKKSGQIIQHAARPSYQVKVSNTKKTSVPQNKKPKQQQKPQQQKQKGSVEQKQNKKTQEKDKPIVTVNLEKQGSQSSKEQRVKKTGNSGKETSNGSREKTSESNKATEGASKSAPEESGDTSESSKASEDANNVVPEESRDTSERSKALEDANNVVPEESGDTSESSKASEDANNVAPEESGDTSESNKLSENSKSSDPEESGDTESNKSSEESLNEDVVVEDTGSGEPQEKSEEADKSEGSEEGVETKEKKATDKSEGSEDGVETKEKKATDKNEGSGDGVEAKEKRAKRNGRKNKKEGEKSAGAESDRWADATEDAY